MRHWVSTLWTDVCTSARGCNGAKIGRCNAVTSHPVLPVSHPDRIFILAGASLSAESGIPTFRGAGGLCGTTGLRRSLRRGLAPRSPAGVGVLFHASARGGSRKKNRLLTVYCDQLRVSSRF